MTGLFNPKAGFTLAELLVSLAILGVIATFTIPKVLYTSQNAQKQAVLKETISSLQAVFTNNWTQGNIVPGGSLNGSYLLNGMNAVKVCSGNAQTQGCWTQVLDGGTSVEAGMPGLLLHNGAKIIGLDDVIIAAPYGSNGFAIDWNGAAGPNLEGDDQMQLHMCWDAPAPCWGEIKTGTIGVRSANAASLTMYRSVFN
ncbi:MAG: hypothetical protein K0Q50_2626 [Vampirovibrio sp.]|jgi:prepilin-type N-terminal cleavage/methylation domain-containing protein|nr:hypothetical protein [Vampirovibrio sp.]